MTAWNAIGKASARPKPGAKAIPPGLGAIMIDRRAAIGILLAALPVALAVAPTRAQDVQKLLALLVDLPGWTGEQALDVVVGGRFFAALRTYKRGDAMLQVNFSRFEAEIPPGDLQSFHYPPGTNYAIAERHLMASTVNGFYTLRDFYSQSKEGKVMVELRRDLFFALISNGVPEREAVALARRFDWKAIEAALPALPK